MRFGKASLKKVVEEEDGRHVEAMHYTTSTKIREDPKLVKLEGEFLPIVLKYEKRGGIDWDDLNLVNHNVQSLIG